MKTLTASFNSDTWEEKPADLIADSASASGLKLVHCSSTRTFKGAITGQGVAYYTMVYHTGEGGTCVYSGMMYFQGKLEGKEEGEAIFVTSGTYSTADGPAAAWYLDEKSGSGGFKGLSARGGYKMAPGAMESHDYRSMEAWLEVVG